MTDTPKSQPPPQSDALFDDAAERFLLQLLDVPAPSGFEEPAAERWRERATEIGAIVTTDRIGTSFAASGGTGTRIAIVGHVDEIGLIVTKIDSKGFLKVTSIGGWDAVVLPGQRVRIVGTPAGGPVIGSISRTAVHALDAVQRATMPKVDELSIDIGVSTAEEARALVRVGDPVVMHVTPQRVGGAGSTRLMSRSIDNRVGAFVALEVVRIAKERGIAADVVAVASVGEEIGAGGATAATYGLRPDRTCVVDVTTPGDTPGASDLGDLALGKGPILSRGATLTARVVDELIEAAEAADIPFQLRAKGLRTATDADQTIKAGPGMATCLVSVPARYLHTPVEQVDLADIRSSIDVIVAWIEHVATKENA
ncbi:MAG: M20/M25/M40 family metallo-hydrolase [Thermoleophilia bacterium]|nr:M20/M25/M40 family metallo-hydrolase [Thermoleophilia bacterium]